jgi:post-segregation antitoxin (ccd killing protein)
MRITVRVPDDVGETVKATTDNVSAYVTEALREKIARDRRKKARKNILDGIRDYEGPGVEEGAEDQLHRERWDSDRAHP